MLSWRTWVGIGAISCSLAVLLGAFGTHALKGQLSEDQARWFKTAFEYHIIHSLGLLVVGIYASRVSSQSTQIAAGSLLLGILLFSGSLYSMALGMDRSIAMLTPIGGLAFTAGWLTLAYSCIKSL